MAQEVYGQGGWLFSSKKTLGFPSLFCYTTSGQVPGLDVAAALSSVLHSRFGSQEERRFAISAYGMKIAGDGT